MDNTKGWFIAIGILVIFSLAALAVVWVVRDTITNTVAPVQNVTGSIGTRVAAILNPTPTILPDPVTIVHSVRSLARLETIQYTVEKVITAETGQGTFSFLFGERLIFVAHGYVIAGVDMNKLQPDDLEVRDSVLYVTLPQPEIFVATLDNDKSYVYDRETGVLTRGDVNLETNARQAAEQAIEESAMDDGILKLAQQNAENYLSRLLRDLGYPEVIFVQATPVP
ncbi:MAG: DUF4230 domain-containing protein [Anaerolineales bacterium]|jgi:hypothetical protein